MIYGKNGKFITIKKSELPLEQRMEKRLTSVREKNTLACLIMKPYRK